MSDENERVKLTTDEAMDRLDIREGYVHTFVNPGGMLLGTDWSESAVRTAIEEHGAELAGPTAESMGHAVVIMRPGRPVYLETKDPSRTP